MAGWQKNRRSSIRNCNRSDVHSCPSEPPLNLGLGRAGRASFSFGAAWALPSSAIVVLAVALLNIRAIVLSEYNYLLASILLGPGRVQTRSEDSARRGGSFSGEPPLGAPATAAHDILSIFSIRTIREQQSVHSKIQYQRGHDLTACGCDWGALLQLCLAITW